MAPAATIRELTEKGRETWRKMDDAIAVARASCSSSMKMSLRLLLHIAEGLARAAKLEVKPPF